MQAGLGVQDVPRHVQDAQGLLRERVGPEGLQGGDRRLAVRELHRAGTQHVAKNQRKSFCF